MRWKFKDLFYKKNYTATLMQKNRQRFDSIICSERYNHLQCVYEQLFDWNATVTDTEILKGYFKFSDNIQTNTFAAAELEWVAIGYLLFSASFDRDPDKTRFAGSRLFFGRRH